MVVSENCYLLNPSMTNEKQTPWPVVHKRTKPTERPPLVGEVSAKFCGERGCHVISAMIPTAVDLGFLDGRDPSMEENKYFI
jgi:hypothetical protein